MVVVVVVGVAVGGGCFSGSDCFHGSGVVVVFSRW